MKANSVKGVRRSNIASVALCSPHPEEAAGRLEGRGRLQQSGLDPVSSSFETFADANPQDEET
jgi:hypothetical protein